MFNYLMEREKDNLLRTATRTLKFPDGTRRKVTAYRLCWVWFDRILGPYFGHEEQELLGFVLKCMETEGVDEGEALRQVLEHVVWEDEVQMGVDYTDDPFLADVARAQIKNFEARKKRRSGGHGQAA